MYAQPAAGAQAEVPGGARVVRADTPRETASRKTEKNALTDQLHSIAGRLQSITMHHWK